MYNKKMNPLKPMIDKMIKNGDNPTIDKEDYLWQLLLDVGIKVVFQWTMQKKDKSRGDIIPFLLSDLVYKLLLQDNVESIVRKAWKDQDTFSDIASAVVIQPISVSAVEYFVQRMFDQSKQFGTLFKENLPVFLISNSLQLFL